MIRQKALTQLDYDKLRVRLQISEAYGRLEQNSDFKLVFADIYDAFVLSPIQRAGSLDDLTKQVPSIFAYSLLINYLEDLKNNRSDILKEMNEERHMQ